MAVSILSSPMAKQRLNCTRVTQTWSALHAVLILLELKLPRVKFRLLASSSLIIASAIGTRIYNGVVLYFH